MPGRRLRTIFTSVAPPIGRRALMTGLHAHVVLRQLPVGELIDFRCTIDATIRVLALLYSLSRPTISLIHLRLLPISSYVLTPVLQASMG